MSETMLKWFKGAVLVLFSIGGGLTLAVFPVLAPSVARTVVDAVGTVCFGASAIGLGVLIGIDNENGHRAR